MSQQQHTQEPVAMIHAEWLERSMIIGAQEAAAELRRLHEVEKQRDTLLAALEELNSVSARGFLYDDPARVKARAAIASVKEQA